MQWHKPLESALGLQRQGDPHELKASVVYIISFRIARATKKDPVSKEKTKFKS